MKIKSESSTIERYHDYDNGFQYHEIAIDGKIKSQWFTRPDDIKKFCYFPKLSEHFDSDICWNTNMWYKIPAVNSKKISRPEKFNDWDNVFAFYIGFDGFIYPINREPPLSLWMMKDYIGGFTNRDFDLVKLAAHLETMPWLRNVSIEPIPYYNADVDRTEGIKFECRPAQAFLDSYYYQHKSKEFWSCRYKEEFGIHGTLDNGLDILKAKQFKKNGH